MLRVLPYGKRKDRTGIKAMDSCWVYYVNCIVHPFLFLLLYYSQASWQTVHDNAFLLAGGEEGGGGGPVEPVHAVRGDLMDFSWAAR